MTRDEWALVPSRQGSPDPSVLSVDGPLHAAQGTRLRNDVQALLRRGRRSIVLSLAGVTSIDAAGIGELVRAYNMTRAATGILRVTESTRRVRELLDRVGLLSMLSPAEADTRFRGFCSLRSRPVEVCPQGAGAWAPQSRVERSSGRGA